jgi:hypothetical protein
MKRILTAILFVIIALNLLACKPSSSPNISQSQSQAAVQNPAPEETNPQKEPPDVPQPAQGQESQEEKSIYDLFVPKEQQSLSVNDYTLSKTSKRVQPDYDGLTSPMTVLYSVLKRKGKVIKKFEYNDFPHNSADFGWVNSSDHPAKHILVGQTEPRSGRFWVIRLTPGYRVLFDTEDFGGSRQELWLEDIDKDGLNELKVVTFGCTSIGFAYNLLCTPQPEIIFKYNKQADRYLPANHLLASYTLGGIEERIAQFKPTSEKPSMKNSQAIEECVDFRYLTEAFLDFIYAGKENQAWAFFDKYYTLPDKKKLKASLKADLRKDPIYRFIYRRQAKVHT